MRRFKTNAVLFILMLLIVAIISLNCAESNSVTVYRDVWGIPHIYTDSEEKVAFGFGYCQAADRIEQLMFSYRYAEGSLAEAFGPKYIEKDYLQKTWRHAKVSQSSYAELPDKIKRICEAFIEGIETYCAEYPEKVPQWAPEIHPWHIIALTRTFIWWWPLDQAMDDLRRRPYDKPHTHGSNQWAVRGNRTATGAPVALIDPHLSFDGEGHWIEARLHGGELDVCGMAVVGTPLIALGHNNHLSWAATTGGPDCGDVYELELHPENSMLYRYDDSWRNLSTDTLKIRIKTENGPREGHRIVKWSHHGPVVKTAANRAFVIKLPYLNQVQLISQVFQMNTAKDLDDFKNALEMGQFMPQNIMYADVENNIYYCRTGRVPIRPEGFDWSRPVPGNTSKTEWQGIHAQEDLVQLLNPNCGYMQNCNISPGTMLPNSPLTSDKYPDYVYNIRESKTNLRGRSAIRLLRRENQLTIERAREIALDTSVDGYKDWLDLLEATYEELKSKYRDLSGPVELLLGWNGRADKENDAAALFRYWRQNCEKLHVNHVLDLKVRTLEQKKLLLIALQQAKADLTKSFGHYRVAWGKTVRISRGKKCWPVSGGSFGSGFSTLRAAWGHSSPIDGVTYVTGGQSCCMIVSLEQPINSYSILPYGQSDDPASPHFSDQAEKLFSESRFKSTFFQKEKLMQHIASHLELKFAE